MANETKMGSVAGARRRGRAALAALPPFGAALLAVHLHRLVVLLPRRRLGLLLSLAVLGSLAVLTLAVTAVLLAALLSGLSLVAALPA